MRILVDPAFRSLQEIFSTQDRARLESIGSVVWGQDEPMPADRFVAEAGQVDAIVFGGWRSGSAGLDAALGSGRLRALIEVAGGHEHDLDYTRCLNQGVAVGSCAPAFADVVAEMGLALALAANRGVVDADRSMRRRSERWLHAGNHHNRTLLGATVGFVGCGGISRSLQRLLEPFGVTVLGYDPPMARGVLEQRAIIPTDLQDMFDLAATIFVLAAPTADNHNLIDHDLLAQLRPHQCLVLLSRGHLVDFDSLAELAAQARFKVATDVYPVEPLDVESALRDLDNVITVPHIAGALAEALLDIGRRVVDDLEALAGGLAPTSLQYLTPDNLDGLRQP